MGNPSTSRFWGLAFHVQTFGCQMNKHDSERVAGMLEALGAEMAGVEEGEFRPPARLRLPAGGEVYDFTPRPEQIDVNRHMNNAAYLDAAEELLPVSFAGREIAAVAIDYEHELPPDCRAQIRIAPEPDACSFEGTLEDKVCFRLRIEYK